MSADETPTEYDDETGRAPDFWESVGDIVRETEAAAAEVRVAFLIASFHAFERRVSRAILESDYRHAKAMQHLKEIGFVPDEDAIDLLRIAANAAKHAPGNSMKKLKQKRPDLVDAEGEVRVSEEQLVSLTRCVRHIPYAS